MFPSLSHRGRDFENPLKSAKCGVCCCHFEVQCHFMCVCVWLTSVCVTDLCVCVCVCACDWPVCACDGGVSSKNLKRRQSLQKTSWEFGSFTQVIRAQGPEGLKTANLHVIFQSDDLAGELFVGNLCNKSLRKGRADPGFWSGGLSGVLTPRGGPEPKICLK